MNYPSVGLFRSTVLPALVSIFLSVYGVSNVPAGGFRVGMDFLDEEFDFVTEFYIETLLPYPLTSPDSVFVLDGGFAGLTESEARWLLTAQVDRYFRSVDVGEPGKTLAVAVYPHRVESQAGTQSLNLAIGEQKAPGGLGSQFEHGNYGVGILDAFFIPHVVPDGSHAGILWPDNFNTLGQSTPFSDQEKVLNALGGTAAQEIAHFFNLRDIPPHDSGPVPIMSTLVTGMTRDQKLEDRAFSTVPGTQANGHSSASLLAAKAGVVWLADLNMDGGVDLLDTAILNSNWGRTDALWHEGDLTGDNMIGLADAAIMSQYWYAGIPNPPAILIPEPAGLALLGLGGLTLLRRRST